MTIGCRALGISTKAAETILGFEAPTTGARISDVSF
jgi:hypothetical protein